MRTLANRALEPKLFSSRDGAGQSLDMKQSSASANREHDTPRASQYVLPQNLGAALRQLSDADIGKLATAVLDERSRRNGPAPVREESHRKRPDETNSPSIPQGKVNAVRAAFQAGVTPNRIAREFGVSRSDVNKVLASKNR